MDPPMGPMVSGALNTECTMKHSHHYWQIFRSMRLKYDRVQAVFRLGRA